MPDASQFTDLAKWGAFKIPVLGFAFVLALLTLRDVHSDIEYLTIVRFTTWALGASVISYGHSLLHSTYRNRRQAPDLPFAAQWVALIFHVIWFALAIYFLPVPRVSLGS